MDNPFDLSFGREPQQLISRLSQLHTIVGDFSHENPTNSAYMLTGVRGSGKTVMMTLIAQQLKEKDDWIVIELNPERDMLQSLGAYLYENPILNPLILKMKLDLSALGFGVSIEKANRIYDIETAIAQMLELAKKHNKKILITVDEVTNTEHVRVFCAAFQILIRKKLPVHLLMTGLYENIYDLQNVKSLTFLYRAPKVKMEPLDLSQIATRYCDIFRVPVEIGVNMAKMTAGYPFAFQVLGHLCWEANETKNLDVVLPEYDQYLSEYVYEKIWHETSGKDKAVLNAMAQSGETKVKSIREYLSMKPEEFSVYRERLIRKGVIESRNYGNVSFALPRFAEYVKRMVLFME